MEMIQRFSGVLHQGYHGNIIYNFFLPSDLSSLSVVLTYQKEHPSDPDSYFNRRRTELATILEQYMEQPVSEDLLRREINAIQFREILPATAVSPVRISPAWQKSS